MRPAPVASPHQNSGTNYFGSPPPLPLKQSSELKGTTLKEVTQLASPPFHIQISTQRQMALVGDHAALQRRVDGSGWSRPVISTI